MKRGRKPTRAPSRMVSAALALTVVAIGFATLMIRLEVVEEGYRLSALRKEIAELQETNRSLKLTVAELGSRQRLRTLAAKYGMIAPARGQVVVVP